MTTRKIVKSTAIGATLLTSLLAAAIANAASGSEWLAEQIALSDGSSYFAKAGAQGPEGRAAVTQGSERDAFLEAQRAISDGSPYAVEYGSGAGAEGRPARSSSGQHDDSFERQRKVSDGSTE
jgi:hypothetical protein